MADDNTTKIRPFTCYFCNKLIDNDTEFGHVSNCGSVLEPCNNKCGSYIPRKMKLKHSRECKNRLSKSMSRLSIDGESSVASSNTNSLGRQPKKPSPFQKQPDVYQLDVIDLSNKLNFLDIICKKLSQSLYLFKTKHQEEMQTQQTAYTQIRLNLEKLNYQTHIAGEWKKNFELQFQTLIQEIATLKKTQNSCNLQLDLEKQNQLIKQTGTSLKQLQEQQHQEQLQNREAHNDLRAMITELKDYVAEENTVIGVLWGDQKLIIEKLLQDIENINTVLSENKTKFGSWVFDLRAVSQISAEASEKLEIQERTVELVKRELAQFKIDFKGLEEQFLNQSSKQDCAVPGYCLWGIKRFNEKFEESKDNEVVLKSPVFYSHHFGYRLRLEIYLNGIKKWKGRYMIACIRVLKGDYDLLLKWPCHIEGTVTLRDLYNHSNPTNFSKYIAIKQSVANEDVEDPQESSTQYIFITHNSLLKQNFIKEDTLFVEIGINLINKEKFCDF